MRLKILYVGPLLEGGTCLQRLKALEYLGHEVLPVDTCPPEVGLRERRLWERAWRRFLGPRDLALANRTILALARQEQPQVLWVDKGLTIRPETLAAAVRLAPGLLRVSYSPDDMLNPRNHSRCYLAAVPRYDLHVTTKSYNVAEMETLGAPRVLFVDNAYCPFTHRPMEVSEADRQRLGGPVGFIGTYERERAEALLFLARQGVPVKVWGNWPRRWQNRHPNLRVMGASLWGDEYARAMCSFAVNLAFLRKENRDLQTTRSIEIPACGGFMLGERTREHQRLFKEGVEAEFFDSLQELLEKIQYYLAREDERQKITVAGRQRCLEAGYSNRERLKGILEQAYQNRGKGKES
jgi:spore maturation protein CgeB